MNSRVVSLYPQWRRALVSPEQSLKEAIRIIDRAVLQIGLVVDENRRLLGVMTDGDVRRALIRHASLDVPVRDVMNPRPVTAPADARREKVHRLMRTHGVQQIPLVREDGVVTGLLTLTDMMRAREKSNAVLLMAGGFGTRLRPLTDHLPKPLLKVGGKPILEHILERFVETGFRRFYISVHYRAEMIKAHFGDGARWGVRIRYLEESEPLGTGGCLRLLPDSALKQDVLVMNGDVLTEADFASLLDFHRRKRADATVCVREYAHQVPFGVVQTQGDRMTAIVEKPVQQFFVNAGIYVLSPSFVRSVPSGCQDIPDLLQKRIAQGASIAVFPMHEYWRDIGRPDDFRQAQADFGVRCG